MKICRLNFDQFFSWIKKHQALYLNYYDGFHNQVWEIDPDTRKPKYLSSAIEKKSDAIEVNEKSKTKVVIYLLHSILVVCNPSTLEKPL